MFFDYRTLLDEVRGLRAELHKLRDIPPIASISRIEVRPGDVFVITLPDNCFPDAPNIVKREWGRMCAEAGYPGVPTIVVSGGIAIGVANFAASQAGSRAQ